MTVTRSQTIRAGLAALIACSAALLVGYVPDVAPAAKAKSPWRVFGSARQTAGHPLLGLGWASNRLWVATVPRGDPVLVSARLSGGRPTDVAETRVPAELSLMPIVDGELVFVRGSGDSRATLTAPLLANGRLGPSKVVSDDLLARGQEVAPKLAGVSILGGTQIEGRTVWALTGGEEARGIGGAPLFFLVCCGANGEAVDLTRFSHRGRGVFDAHVGVDTRGRIWLAWGDTRDRRGAIIVELDRSTLAPRSKPLAVPGVRTAHFDLACAASCRLVVQTNAGDIVSWAPGEGPPTRVATRASRLLAASYRSGRLAVAYLGPGVKSAWAGQIHIVQGNAQGARARAMGSIDVTYGWPLGKLYPSTLEPVIDAAFVPGGVVATEWFQVSDAPSPVIYAYVPLGR